MVEKILAILLFFPISMYTTVQYTFIHWGKSHTLAASQEKIVNGGTWETATPLPTKRYEFGAALVGDEIYAVGGLYLPTVYAPIGRMEAYNIKTNTWRDVASLPVPIHHPGVTSDGTYVYVIGGDGVKVTPYNIAYRYDPQKNAWEKLPDMPTKRGALGLVTLNGKIYAIGGAAYNKKFNTVEVYDTKTKKWETKKSMPTPREHLGIAVAGGKIYVMGGFTTERFESLKTVEVYDPQTDTWETGKDLPLLLSGFSAATVHDKIYIFGGQQGVPVSGEVHEYDPKTETWTRKRDLSFPRYAVVSVVVGDKIHILGGSEVVGGYQFVKNHEVFRP